MEAKKVIYIPHYKDSQNLNLKKYLPNLESNYKSNKWMQSIYLKFIVILCPKTKTHPSAH